MQLQTVLLSVTIEQQSPQMKCKVTISFGVKQTIVMKVYSHEDGEGETEGVISGGSASNSLPDGGLAWAKTTFGSGLDEGTWGTVGVGGSICCWGEGALTGAKIGGEMGVCRFPFLGCLFLCPKRQPGGSTLWCNPCVGVGAASGADCGAPLRLMDPLFSFLGAGATVGE